MQNICDPRQEALFDVWGQILSPMAYRKLKAGWPGVFRHVILGLMPVDLVAEHFDPTMGRPTKELYSMAGLLLIAEFKDWTPEQAANAYIFHTDVQYALNLEPAGQSLCARTVERYQKLFIDNEIAAEVMLRVTDGIAQKLELDISRQRLDSTHIFSDMAVFGRTRLMGVSIKRFLTQLKRHDRADYDRLPEELRARYSPSPGRMFAEVASDRKARRRLRQRVAEEMQYLVERFADYERIQGRSTYRQMLQVFTEQCEVLDREVAVREHPGGDAIQNPSDPDATRDGHKGSGYQAQVTETCSPENEVQLITCALPQTAVVHDGRSLPDVLEGLEQRDMLPDLMYGDRSYGSDENVQLAASKGVDLQSPVAGQPKEEDPYDLNIDDFTVDEETGQVQRCPAGHKPEHSEHDGEEDRTLTRMPAERCHQCDFKEQCPVKLSGGRATLKHTGKQRRLAARRREQDTEAFREAYRIRSGGESLFSGTKRRLGLGRLRVRGTPAVSYKILMKLTSWNILRAAASEKLREMVASAAAAWGQSSANTRFPVAGIIGTMALMLGTGPSQGLGVENRTETSSFPDRFRLAPFSRCLAA